MPRTRTPRPPAPAKSYGHPEAKRRNVPTEQTERFMGENDRRPIAYTPDVRARTGPALAWGRDENLEKPATFATPLYVHEKISPAAFAEQLREKASNQGALFSDFNGLDKNAAFEWYQHEGNWSNRIIRGPSVEVMASLLEKENMAGEVQMIYFDPPYGINFKSTMQPSTKSRSVKENSESIPAEPQVVKAFRDSYKNGIHSYLDNVYLIATYARNLLSESGSFFLQIGADNVHRIALILDEVFDHENFVRMITFQKTGGNPSKTLPGATDYILWYAKDKDNLKYFQLFEELKNRKEAISHMSSYAMLELEDGTNRNLTPKERATGQIPDHARLFRRMRLQNPTQGNDRTEDYEWNDKVFSCRAGEQWRVNRDGLDQLAAIGRLVASGDGMLSWKRYEDEVPGKQINNLWGDTAPANDLHYIVETSERVIERCILMSTSPGDLVLDPTCGSGTTAFVAESWGRRWITIDCSSVAISLTRQRLLTGAFPYYILQDSEEGASLEYAKKRAIKPDLPPPPPPPPPARNIETAPKRDLFTSAYLP